MPELPEVETIRRQLNLLLAGKKIKEIELPKDAVLVSIVRGEEVILPKGDTVLQSGDDIIAMAMVGNESQLINCLLGRM